MTQSKNLDYILLFFWILAVFAGLGILSNSSNTPSSEAKAQKIWPRESKLPRDKLMPTLLIFAHPQCSCTAATLAELDRLIPFIKDKIKINVIFVNPDKQSEGWMQQSLWKTATALPYTEVILDQLGAEAENFKAYSSGQTFLYTKDGILIFSGGITPSKGHQGNNIGSNAILSYAKKGIINNNTSSVFGCSLKNPIRDLSNESKK